MIDLTRTKVKTFDKTYVYSQTEYEKKIIEYIINSERIDTKSEGFKSIKEQVKVRQNNTQIYRLLENNNVILMHNNKPAPKVFTVSAMKDIKNPDKRGSIKIFIDCSAILYKNNGVWVTNQIDKLISHLASAIAYYMYFTADRQMLYNNEVAIKGTGAFAKLFTNIIDYLFKISQIDGYRDKCLYMASLYYLTNLTGRGMDDASTTSIAKKVAKISDNQARNIRMDLYPDDMINLKTFIDKIKTILKIEGLTVDMFLEKWIFLYGPGTVLACEYYPSFAEMLINAYVGAYLNNQKTIEGLVAVELVDFTKAVFRTSEGVIL